MSNVQFVSEQFSAYEAYPICKRIAVLLKESESAVKIDKEAVIEKLKAEIDKFKIINNLWREKVQEKDCLNYLIRQGRLDIVQYLVEECHYDVKNNKELIPLHLASFWGNLDIIKYFVEECQCDVNAKDNNEFTPLHIAARFGHLNIVKYLVEKCHCDINMKDWIGYTPLRCASEHGHFDIVKYLVEECHCDVNVKDNNGFNHYWFCYPDRVLNYLLSRGATL